MKPRLSHSDILSILDTIESEPIVTVKTKKSSNKLQSTIESAREQLKYDDRLECVTRINRLREYMRKVKLNGICAIDTETTGLDPLVDKVVGICLYTPQEKAIYVPINHVDDSGIILQGQIDASEISEIFNLDGIKWIFHNAKFDIRFMQNSFSVNLQPFFDTSLGGNYLNENEPHKLKYLHSKYVLSEDSSAATFSDLFDSVQFDRVPLDIAYLYAAADALKTYELFEFQWRFLNPESHECIQKGLQSAAKFLLETEIPLIPILADMENRGIGLDIELSNKLHDEYTSKANDFRNKCETFLSSLDLSHLQQDKRSKLSDPIKLTSPLQLSIIFYDVLNLKSPDPKAPRGTGADILEHFSSNIKYGDFFTSLIKFREITKLLTTYIDKLPDVVNNRTKKIHGSFNQFGAKTGRFSSSNPNLQNIPASDKNIRKMFVPSEGNVFISCDYSQQEPRVLAHVSSDNKMKQAYEENKDLYSWIASVVYSKPYEMCKEVFEDGTKNEEGKKMRTAMKSVVLGLMYGRGSKAIAEQLNIPNVESKRIIDMFFDAFPDVRKYIYSVQEYAKRFGYVSTVYGRKRRLPDIRLPQFEFTYQSGGTVDVNQASYLLRLMRACRFEEKEEAKYDILKKYSIVVHDNGPKIADAERQSINSIIQGSSADITKHAMLRIGTSKKLIDLGAKMVLTVHDEIIVECPIEHAKEASKEMITLMIDAAKDDISVPMKVDCDITDRWYGENLDV